MTHLTAIYENGLHPQAKLLYGILHAYAGADGIAVVREDLVAKIMGIRPARLRGYRSELNRSGYCSVALRGENIIFQITSDSDPDPARESRVVARESDHETSLVADSDPDPARESRVVARESRAVARAGGDNRGGRLVGINYLTLPEKNSLPTNQPVSAQATKLQPWEAEASEGLLLAVGCENLPAIRRTAADFPFVEIRAHALAWQRDTKTTGPGGLLHRIRSGEFAVPILTDDDRRSSLFLRHRTPSEIAADAERERQAAEENRRWEEQQAERERQRQAQQPAVAVPVASSPGSPVTRSAADIWQMALNDLALSMPAPTFNEWIRDTNVLGYEDSEFVIGVPHAYARDWLTNRLRPQIKRILSRLTSRSTEVTFTVRPRPHTNGAT